MDLGAAWTMVRRSMLEHGLDDWELRFDTAKRRAGVCRCSERVIGLSAPLTRVHDESQVRETGLHEIAHALVGPEHGHDAVWRRTARAIGSSGERCVPEDVPGVRGAWLGTCPRGHVVERHRRPTRVAACSRCATTFSPEALLTWTHHGRPVAMHPNYVAELEAVIAGRPVLRARPGAAVTVKHVPGAGGWAGREGVVVSVGRTRYGVRLREGVLRVPFAWVDLRDDDEHRPWNAGRARGPASGAP